MMSCNGTSPAPSSSLLSEPGAGTAYFTSVWYRGGWRRERFERFWKVLAGLDFHML